MNDDGNRKMLREMIMRMLLEEGKVMKRKRLMLLMSNRVMMMMPMKIMIV